MKLFSITLSLSVMWLGSAAELLVNPDFGRSSPAGLPLGWELRGAGVDQCAAIPGGVRLTAEAETAVLVQSDLELVPGESYLLRLRGAGPAGPAQWRAYCEWTQPRGDGGVDWFATPVEWQDATAEGVEYRAPFAAPAAAVRAHLALMVRPGGTVEFTGLSLNRLEMQPEKSQFGGRWRLTGEASWCDDGDAALSFALPAGSAALCRGVPLKPGERYTLEFEIKGLGRPDNLAEFAAYRVELTWPEGEQTQAPWDDTWNSDFQTKRFTFTVPAGCAGMTDIAVSAGAPGAIFRHFTLAETPLDAGERFSIRFDAPVWRDSLYASMPAEAINGSVIAPEPVSDLTVRLAAEDGECFAGRFETERFSIPAAELPYGTYRLSVEFDGTTLEREFHKRPPAAVEVIQDGGRNFRIDGEPFFPILCWEAPDGERLRHLASQGFNLMLGGRVNAEKRALAYLEECREAGVMAMLNIGFPEQTGAGELPLWEHRLHNILTPQVLAHPALFGYYLADEPYWAGVAPEKLLHGYDMLARIDPYRPVWINAAPRGSVEVHRIYSRAADIYGADIYPVPYPCGHSALEDRMMSAVGAYARRMLDAAGPKAIWMTLQGFSWFALEGPDGGAGYPTPEELRYMAFDAIVSGATGITYWGMNHVRTPEFLTDLFRQSRELHELSALLAGGVRSAAAAADAPSVRVLTLEYGAALYLIAVNDDPGAVDCRIAAPLRASRVEVAGEDRTLPVADGTIRDRFAGYAVHIYAEAPLPPATPLPPEPGGDPFAEWIAARRTASRYEGDARWIWHPDLAAQPGSRVVLVRTFTLDSEPVSAEALLAADDFGSVLVNGIEAGDIGGWTPLKRLDIGPLLRRGGNTVEIRAADAGSLPCGVIGEITVAGTDGSRLHLPTDASWLAAPDGGGDFTPAREIAAAGSGVWGDRIEMPIRESAK